MVKALYKKVGKYGVGKNPWYYVGKIPWYFQDGETLHQQQDILFIRSGINH